MRAHIRGAEKPTAAVINSIGSVIPAGACWRGGIWLRFAFIGSCFDDGGMNRQRRSCGQQQENRRQYFLPQHPLVHPCYHPRQTSNRLRLATSRSAPKIGVNVSCETHTSPIRRWNRLRRPMVAPTHPLPTAVRTGKKQSGTPRRFSRGVWNEIGPPEPADLLQNCGFGRRKNHPFSQLEATVERNPAIAAFSQKNQIERLLLFTPRNNSAILS